MTASAVDRRPDTGHDSPPTVVLTGFMGTGKSSVGRRLAAELGREFVDTDAVVVERWGPITELFVHEGEAGFRRREAEIVAELAQRRGLVVATGGGSLLDPSVSAPLEAVGRVFCLTAEVDTILERVRSDGLEQRPLLADPDPVARLTELLSARQARYSEFEPVPTDGRTVDEIVADLVARLGQTEPQ